MGFGALLGNRQLKENLTESLSKGHISHCYLITGPEGSGKRTLARLLAQAILCQGTDKPCGVCTPCRKILDGNHPDYILVDDPEKKTVPVELIRQARADMFIQPNESDHKIYQFPRAQDMGIRRTSPRPPHAAAAFWVRQRLCWKTARGSVLRPRPLPRLMETGTPWV